MMAGVYSRVSNDVYANAMRDGLLRHGVNAHLFNHNRANDYDFIVCWSWRVGNRFRLDGYTRPILVMERGYLGDRFQWTSLGWNGLNGRAVFNPNNDKSRFDKHFGHLVSPWRKKGDYALLIGQVLGDMSLMHVNIHDWYASTFKQLVSAGYDVKFRPHPEAVKRGQRVQWLEPYTVGGDLHSAIDNAKLVVTYNSNTGVESVLAGKPTLSFDIGSMAYPVTGHNVKEIITPKRNAWYNKLAWTQWKTSEIADGTAWDNIGAVIPMDDRKTRVAAILGGGSSVWADAKMAFRDYRPDATILINDTIADYPGEADIAVTLHPEKLPAWLKARDEAGYPAIPEIVSYRTYNDLVTRVEPYLWPEMKYSGSSGLYAIKVALSAGYDRNILCGVPMSADHDHYLRKAPWRDTPLFIPAWDAVRNRIAPFVRSYSGWTASQYGRPTMDWVNG